MILQRLHELKFCRSINSVIIVARSKYCNVPVCGIGKGKSAAKGGAENILRRPERSGPVRLGFLPEEWFVFFEKKTGVTGPYFLMLGITNYVCSKEIYVMEHEYYSGLSLALVLYLLSTRMGPQIGAALDKEVDAVYNNFQKGRDDEIAFHNTVIKESKLAIERTQGQVELVAAKKENILLQLEAAYRERAMMVYNSVVGRMLYHLRKQQIENRIHQKWMIHWILKNVRQSITPEFQKRALKSAISDLTNMSNRAK